MKPYSLDRRRRVLDAWQRGEGSQRQLASRFSVHLTFVRNLLRLYRQSGSIEPRPHGGGRRSLAEGPVLERLAQIMVRERPDDTLDEHRERLAAQGGPALSRAALWRALERLKLSVKKKPARHRARPKAGASPAATVPRAGGRSTPAGPGLRGRKRG
jgi:transposase